MASHAAAAFAPLALLAACAGEDPRAALPQVRARFSPPSSFHQAPPPPGRALLLLPLCRWPLTARLWQAFSADYDYLATGSITQDGNGTLTYDLSSTANGRSRHHVYVTTRSDQIGDFWLKEEMFSDYNTADQWIHACDNQTSKVVCNCCYNKLPPGRCQSLNTSAWTYIGDDGSCDGTTPHSGCTKWQHLKSAAEDQEAYYWVTETTTRGDNELRHKLIWAPEQLWNQSENVTDTRIGTPPASTWAIPPAWGCVGSQGPNQCPHSMRSRGGLTTVADVAARARELAAKGR